MDAVDAALVEFNEKAVLKFYNEYPIESSLKNQIRQINEKSNLIDVARSAIDTKFTGVVIIDPSKRKILAFSSDVI